MEWVLHSSDARHIHLSALGMIYLSVLLCIAANRAQQIPFPERVLCPYNGTDGTVKNTTIQQCSYSQSQWDCPQGSFCQVEGNAKACSPGFYCPPKAFHPIYCPGGFQCSNDSASMTICPKNFYCPIGTVKPYKCSYLAYCPEGTEDAPKVVLFLVMLILLLIPVFFFKWKDASNAVRRLKHKYEVESINNRSSASLMDQQSLSRLEQTFDIEFKDLSLKLPNGVTIMSGVSGALRSGRTTAIMGPSGAGKTTFITLLTGKTKRTTGSVLINGKPDELSNYKKLIGYVPQEDIMLRELTVHDILMHSARMRLPAGWNYKKIKSKVLEIISFLGMSHVLDSIVGNEEERGISGGQRKRVNIGMELVAEPSVLFLDEPTSGLDSSTSYDVCAKLREIARQQGITIAAVIHSPSPTTFREFDDFLLLGKGGKVVYMGPRELAAQYFAGIGFECPPGESESDFFMDVVSDRKKSSLDPNFKLTDLFHYWELTAAGKSIVPVNRAHENAEQEVKKTAPVKKLPWYKSFFVTLKTGIVGLYSFLADVLLEYFQFLKRLFRAVFCIPDPIRDSTPMYRQLLLLMKRASKQVFRNARVIIFDILLHFGCGTFISIATQNFTYLGRFPDEVCATQTLQLQWMCYNPTDNIKMAGMFVALGVFFAGISAGSSTFGREKVVFWRDTAAGMSAIPYYLGKFLIDFPRVIVAGAAYSAALVLFYPLKGPFPGLLLLVELLYFNAFAMGYFLSIIFAPAKVPLIGTGFALFWSLCLSGVIPELKEVYKAPLNSFAFLWSLSPPRWGIEFFWIMEVDGTAFGNEVESYWNYLVQTNQTKDFYNGFTWTNQQTDLINILLLAVLWNFLSFFSLKLTNREKQK